MTLRTLYNKRYHFWSKEPTGEQRRAKIETILKEARKEFIERSANGGIDPRQHRNKMVFLLDGEIVCEKAYANMLGLANDNGAVSKVWRDEAKILSGKLRFFRNHLMIPVNYCNCM